MNGAFAAALAAALMAFEAGSTEAPARLVGFDDLQRRLGDSNLRLLDARPRGEYDAGHIPGAVWVNARAVEERAARPGL
jgi:thiosulfate/3-mercaptopyruvate sulfurtransferase